MSGAKTSLVAAVVVNWNGKDDLLRCVESLVKSDYPSDKFKIAVVDNASTDGSCAALRKAYSEVFIINNITNQGYVKAANQGIAHGVGIGADYVWLFNNDVVVAADTLSRMVAIGQKDEAIGVIAPVIYSFQLPEHIDHVGYKINFWTGQLRRLKWDAASFAESKDDLVDVDSALGCSNLIKMAVFKKIGFFRPVYQVYFEETDFNVRALRHGFRVVVAKQAKVWHKNAATMDRFIFWRAFLLLRNLFIFEILNANAVQLLVFIPYYFLIHLPIFLVRGIFYGLKGRY